MEGTDVHSFYIELTLNQTSFPHKKTPADV
jgi:hypothetical protein